MKRLLLGTAGLGALAVATTAFAADMPVKAPLYKAPPPAPVYSWTGWYIGGNAGYGWNSDSVDVVGTPLFANPLSLPGTVPSLAAAVAGVTGGIPVNSKGFIGGGQIEYKKQFDKIVAGIEADIQGTSIRGSGNAASLVPVVGFPGTFAQTSVAASNRLNYLGTLRADLGVTVTPAVLLYGTGGLAYGGVNSNTNIAQAEIGTGAATVNVPYGSAANLSDTRIGWTAGAGIAWMMFSNWSAKIEYLHYDLGTANYGANLTNIVGPPGGAVPTGAAFYSLAAGSSTHFSGDIVRFGLNYKFAM